MQSQVETNDMNNLIGLFELPHVLFPKSLIRGWAMRDLRDFELFRGTIVIRLATLY